jgi:hypothetical protein
MRQAFFSYLVSAELSAVRGIAREFMGLPWFPTSPPPPFTSPPPLRHAFPTAHDQVCQKLLLFPMSSPVELPANGLDRSAALAPSTDANQTPSGDVGRAPKRARKKQSFTCSWNECRRVFGKLEHLQRHQRSRRFSGCISGHSLRRGSRCR